MPTIDPVTLKVTNLQLAGSITGATTGAFSGAVTLSSTLAVTGAATVNKLLVAVAGTTASEIFGTVPNNVVLDLFNADATNGYGVGVRVSVSDATRYLLRLAGSAGVGMIVYSNGSVTMPQLPTSSAGLPSKSLWNNAGVINQTA